MNIRELGFVYVVFAYMTSGVLIGVEYTLEPYVDVEDLRGNQGISPGLEIPNVNSGNGSIVELFEDDISDNQNCSIDEDGIETCEPSENVVSDNFFGIGFEAIGSTLKLISGTAIFDLFEGFGISEFWINVFRLPVGVITLRTVFYLVTGR